jgi:dihydrodipicolinate reductase
MEILVPIQSLPPSHQLVEDTEQALALVQEGAEDRAGVAQTRLTEEREPRAKALLEPTTRAVAGVLGRQAILMGLVTEEMALHQASQDRQSLGLGAVRLNQEISVAMGAVEIKALLER